MNYIKVIKDDISDGPGVRVAIYASGCRNHCKGCHSPNTWDFSCGNKFNQSTIDDIIAELRKSYIAGLSILGGEPLDTDNQFDVLNLVTQVKIAIPDKSIWLWTGYEYEELLGSMSNPVLLDILDSIDIAVVGRFEIDKRDISDMNRWRGSTNQRVICTKESLRANRPVALEGIPNNIC